MIRLEVKVLLVNNNLKKVFLLMIHLSKEWHLIYTDEAQSAEKYSFTVPVLAWAWTSNWTFIWVLSLQAAVQTWHWHQADNICKGYSVKTREGKSLKSLARSLYHGPWCLHRTYLRKLRQLGMFVQLPASSMHTYIQCIHTVHAAQCIHTVHMYTHILINIL